MRRVRILSPMAGNSYQSGKWRIGEFVWDAGQEVEIPDELARALCTEPEDQPRAEYIETTSMAPPETAAMPRFHPRTP